MAGEFEALTEISPVEVYQFLYGKGSTLQIFRYTSNGEAVTVTNSSDYAGEGASLVFHAETLKRGEVDMSGEMNKSVLQLQVNKNNAVADLFISGTPTSPIDVKVWRMSEEGLGLDKLSVFQGRVTGCSFTGMEATLNLEPIFTQLQKAGLRRMYETTCSHSLYDQATCKVNRHNGGVEGWVVLPHPAVPGKPAVTFEGEVFIEAEADTPATTGTHLPSFELTLTRNTDFTFTEEGEILVSLNSVKGLMFDALPYDTKTGLVLTHTQTTLPEDPATLRDTTAYYTGGFVTLLKSGATDGTMHMVLEHTRGKLTLIRSLPATELEQITEIALYPGCDHFATTCKNKFGNIENFGGFPYMRSANPFVGTHVPVGG